MPDKKEAEDVPRESYADYLYSIYQNGILLNKLPSVTTNPNLLEPQARKAMKPEVFDYVHGGAGEMSTMDSNRLAFRQWKLIPRFMRGTKPHDLRVSLFGKTYASPILMAPIGVQGIFHPDGEKAVAQACAELDVPYTLSTASTTSIEDVAGASGPKAPRWFQLYWPVSEDITASLLGRAKKCGFNVLVVTLDTFTMGWRPLDLDRAHLPFATGTGNAVGFSDPVFRRKFESENDGERVEDNVILASRAWTSEIFPGDGRDWSHLEVLRRHWSGPILLKGILSVEDAKKAAETGLVDGIIVSNHGGRQLDGAVASLEVLPEIVDAVGHRLTVLFDSGIRTGADVMKALALGARAVFVGRPIIYGLGIAGKEGAKSVLAGLLADFDQSVGLGGFRSVKELGRHVLRKVSYGGDLKSNM
jgi:isopentenyl diphosphate isomerase/L-lactate dehydrogenase-like FMN-dependent dehydrogenase